MSANRKRFLIALTFGFLSGLLCYLGGIYFVGIETDIKNSIWIILNRTLIGFVIGISNLKIHWILNGALIGATIGLLFPYYIFLQGGRAPLLITSYLLSILFGILIEFFTSIVFKARISDRIRSA